MGMINTDLDEETIFAECSCYSPEHQMIFKYVHDKFIEEDQIYMRTHLITYKNVWKRTWRSLKYIFGYKCRYGQFDEVILKTKDVKTLRDMFDAYLIKHER